MSRSDEMGGRKFSQLLEAYLDLRDEEAESDANGACLVEPIGSSAKRHKQMDELLEEMDAMLAERAKRTEE